MSSTDPNDFGNTAMSGDINNSAPFFNYTIPIVDDNLLEGRESFYLTLTAMPGSLTQISEYISPNLTEIIINDNDG